MEQNKYYTPEISELYVGYQCEHTSNMSAFIVEDYDAVVKNKLTSTDLRWYTQWAEEENGLEKFVRTQYLTQQDIESLGWFNGLEGWFYKDIEGIVQLNGEFFNAGQWCRFGDYELHYNFNDKFMIISDESRKILFNGEIKSINELRKLMTWLKIK